jgi:hypothetical protein
MNWRGKLAPRFRQKRNRGQREQQPALKHRRSSAPVKKRRRSAPQHRRKRLPPIGTTWQVNWGCRPRRQKKSRLSRRQSDDRRSGSLLDARNRVNVRSHESAKNRPNVRHVNHVTKRTELSGHGANGRGVRIRDPDERSVHRDRNEADSARNGNSRRGRGESSERNSVGRGETATPNLSPSVRMCRVGKSRHAAKKSVSSASDCQSARRRFARNPRNQR